MIFPEIFDGKVMGFFTSAEVGEEVRSITLRPIYMPKQEHTDIIIDIEDDLSVRTADAVFTQRSDIIVGVKTADCVPVLLFDPDSQVVGAVHAGWRGTAQSIVSKSIAHMCSHYGSSPDNILVAIGPCIMNCCYEVDLDIIEQIKKTTGDGDYYTIKGGKAMLNLAEANKLQSIEAGVPAYNISSAEECTHCLTQKYNSFRRNGTKKRQGGFIGMP